MSDPAPVTSQELAETLSRLTATVDRLETALDQLTQALKRQHNINLSPELATMVRSIRRDTASVNRLVGQTANKTHQLEELVRTFALITSSLEPDHVLEEVMDTVIHLSGAERGYLMLHEASRDEYVIRTSRNRGRQTLSEEDVIFSRSIANAAVEGRRPIITSNAQDDPRFQGAVSVSVQNLRSILCIPLMLRDKVMGVLYADNPITQGLFTTETLPILTAFASQAAIAIDNANRFHQVRADLQRAEKEVMELRIQIDERKKEQQVKAITETEYFQELESLAKNLRRKAKGG